MLQKIKREKIYIKITISARKAGDQINGIS